MNDTPFCNCVKKLITEVEDKKRLNDTYFFVYR